MLFTFQVDFVSMRCHVHSSKAVLLEPSIRSFSTFDAIIVKGNCSQKNSARIITSHSCRSNHTTQNSILIPKAAELRKEMLIAGIILEFSGEGLV